MTTEPSGLAANLARIETLSLRLNAALARLPVPDPALSMPVPLMAQLSEAWRAAPKPEAEGDPDPTLTDPAWDRPPYDILRRAHAERVAQLHKLAGPDTPLDWLARQVAAMLSPANTLATNPEAQARAAETGGASLVRGMENLLADVEASDLPEVPLSAGFEPGRDLAVTPGEVVLRTEVMELIRYAPQTGSVHARPLVIVPPWINRFYILDLQPQNSLVRWLVGQGLTVFMISWRDPGPPQRDQGLEAHVGAVVQAMRAAQDMTGADLVNTAGYCIGGTALVLALGAMSRRGEGRAASATLMATLIDFSDPGAPGVYLTPETTAALERQADAEGVLDRRWLGRGFAMLRSDALVWRPAVRRYLMGEDPPRHDMLFWNGDGTNLSARMVHDLLDTLYRDNALVEGLDMLGERVGPADVGVPVYAVACARDHIAPAAACRAGFDALQGAGTFVLAEAGHVAGIVNPPEAGRYGFTVDGGARQAGSWWPHWGAWLAERSGPQVPAVPLAPALMPAPGAYVRNGLPSRAPVIDRNLRQKRADAPEGTPPMSLASDDRAPHAGGGDAFFSEPGPVTSRDSRGKGGRMADTDKPLLIKRYASRRLYNTETSDYVTLEDIARFIQSGRDVKIVDLKSGDDLTRQYLLQIIAEHEAKGENVLPLGVLTDLIRSYTGKTESVVPQLLAASFEMVQQHQAQVMESLSTAGFGQVPGFDAMRKQQEVFMRSMLRGWGAEPPPAPAPEPAETDLADIRKQLAELQEKLSRL